MRGEQSGAESKRLTILCARRRDQRHHTFIGKNQTLQNKYEMWFDVPFQCKSTVSFRGPLSKWGLHNRVSSRCGAFGNRHSTYGTVICTLPRSPPSKKLRALLDESYNHAIRT